MRDAERMTVLKLSLHNHLVGYLIGYQHGRNQLVFADSFRQNVSRPTLSLITHPRFPQAIKIMDEPWTRNQRLHPLLSNLLPEGVLRELLTKGLKIHINDEFQLFSHLGRDLPGALIATALSPQDVPEFLLRNYSKSQLMTVENISRPNKFSLAGVQMKFSMKRIDGRFNITTHGELGDWIVKTPSTQHQYVPANEFTAMSLASLVGVDIPEIKLVETSALDNLPPINLTSEKLAFAIKRFDRQAEQRIHMEDFAQVLVKYPREKYTASNYEQIGKVIKQYSGDYIVDMQQLARRILVNILLANGDAHLKNWSLLYADKITPRLSPAYDIVTTSVYIENEEEFSLKLAKNRNWYKVNLSHFEAWSEKTNIAWRIIKPHLQDVIAKARDLWPRALNNLPMYDAHKKMLQAHWQRLHEDFKI